GLMRFNSQQGGRLLADCGSSKEMLIGTYNPSSDYMVNATQSDFGRLGQIRSGGWTPLAETMAEAGLYFTGQNSWYNSGTSYTSPIQYRCQNNYVILMTDGQPTRDDDPPVGGGSPGVFLNGRTIPQIGNGNSLSSGSYLDDIAYALQTEDLSSLGSPGDFEKQTVTTHTIGFLTAQNLLQNTADLGGGDYYTANNADELGAALQSILEGVGSFEPVYASVSVPIDSANGAYSGNTVYLGLFQPINLSNWQGNLKKYGRQGRRLMDASTPAKPILLAGTSNIDPTAQSYWSTIVDGASSLKGGVAEKLRNMVDNHLETRNVYTYTGSLSAGNLILDLTDEKNRFAASNEATFTTVPANPDLFATDVSTVINSTLDAAMINSVRKGIPIPADNPEMDSPLGSIIHSKPLFIPYEAASPGDNDDMICVGANDGMMHCFNEEDGSENWAYIPHNLLRKVDQLPSADALQYYVDAPLTLYEYNEVSGGVTEDKKLLFFGQRRGGDVYTALDISDRDTPLFKYSIGADFLKTTATASSPDYETLGQSWTAAKPLTVAYDDNTAGDKTKEVFILTGGYDTNQDKLPGSANPPAPEDSVGRAFFAVESKTGALLENLLFSHADHPEMTHSIVALSAFENPQTRTTTRIYAGDMNGNLFAARDDIFHYNRKKSNPVGPEQLYDGKEDGNWQDFFTLFASPGLKIFSPPEVVSFYYPVEIPYPAGILPDGATSRVEKRAGEYVYYGTGDHENLREKEDINEFYAIKNNWQWGSGGPDIVKARLDENTGVIYKVKDDNTLGEAIYEWNTAEGRFVATTTPAVDFLFDITDDLYQNTESDPVKKELYIGYVKMAMEHENNRGWFLQFLESDGSKIGEKVVTSPLIYAGVVYFSTFVPDEFASTGGDPCITSGAMGKYRDYAIGYKYGEAVIDFSLDNPNDTDMSTLIRSDRFMVGGVGLPPGGSDDDAVGDADGMSKTGNKGFRALKDGKAMVPFYWKRVYTN
ncbi:MAG: hypothetical protein CSA20_08775, partial [Deltaproteobacteria bacterium]